MEDERWNRTLPYQGVQFPPTEVCLASIDETNGRLENVGSASVMLTGCILRTVPKVGSQSLSRLLSSWPNATQCTQARRDHQRPLVFAFVRHPYTRLVSGFTRF